MALEDPNILKVKNSQRLGRLIGSMFSMGINITAPSKLKDSLRIFSLIILIGSWASIYGLYEFMMRNKHNMSAMMESFCIILQVSISIFKLTYLTNVQRRFFNILRKMESHELVEELHFLSIETSYNKDLRKKAVSILDQNWRVGAGQFNFYLYACIAVSGFYFCFNVGSNAYHSFVRTENYTNSLPLPTLFPFWEDKINQFPYYHILVVTTGLGCFIAAIGAVSFDGFYIYAALHGVALIQILKNAIGLITSSKVPKHLRPIYLRQCIGHYERTYQYCTELNGLYFYITLVQFLMSLVILGVVMFQAAVGLESDFMVLFRMILYISAAGFEVVIYCLNGQWITSESEDIPNAWYECEWYNESQDFKQLILMMILRTNRPIIMNASGFTTMSLPTLISILRSSGSYFLLLRNLNSY